MSISHHRPCSSVAEHFLGKEEAAGFNSRQGLHIRAHLPSCKAPRRSRCAREFYGTDKGSGQAASRGRIPMPDRRQRIVMLWGCGIKGLPLLCKQMIAVRFRSAPPPWTGSSKVRARGLYPRSFWFKSRSVYLHLLPTGRRVTKKASRGAEPSRVSLPVDLSHSSSTGRARRSYRRGCWFKPSLCDHFLLRIGAVVARWVHTSEAAGSNPASASSSRPGSSIGGAGPLQDHG